MKFRYGDLKWSVNHAQNIISLSSRKVAWDSPYWYANKPRKGESGKGIEKNELDESFVYFRNIAAVALHSTQGHIFAI